jgi:hypothetical protein
MSHDRRFNSSGRTDTQETAIGRTLDRVDGKDGIVIHLTVDVWINMAGILVFDWTSQAVKHDGQQAVRAWIIDAVPVTGFEHFRLTVCAMDESVLLEGLRNVFSGVALPFPDFDRSQVVSRP